MHTVVYALVPHSDIAKFEVEDGLARGAAAELLAAPSTISQVVVDIATAGIIDVDSPHTPPGFDALLRVSAESMADAQPAHLAELVADVASVAGAWTISTISIAEREDDWIGSATPGVKLVALLSSGPGIDRGSFDGWLREALLTCANDLAGVGVVTHTPEETLEGSRQFDSLVEFSFSTQDGLAHALEAHMLQSVLGSELLDSDKTQVFTTVEHLLTPNENAWEMHDSADASPDE